jgi:hypothetical protein
MDRLQFIKFKHGYYQVVINTNCPNSLPNIIRQIKSRKMSWAGHVVRVGGQIKSVQGFGGKPEEKRPIGTPKRIWEDGISVRKHDFY